MGMCAMQPINKVMYMSNTTSQDSIDVQEAMLALSKSNFNLDLCAEKLHVTKAEILEILTTGQAEADILTQMRLRLALDVYQLWGDMKLFMLASLAEAKPKEIIAAFNILTTSLNKSLERAPIQQELNIETAVLNMLPASARKAVMNIIEADAATASTQPTQQATPTSQDGQPTYSPPVQSAPVQHTQPD